MGSVMDLLELRRSIIASEPHLETIETDGIASFKTSATLPIKSMVINFEPVQEGEGDPSPENVRPITGWNSIKIRKTGKNLAKIVGYSATSPNDASSTRRISNSYGTILSTTDYSDKLSITQTQYPEPSNLKLYSNGYFCIILDGLLYDKKYNVSFKISNVVSNPLNATLSDIIIANPYGTYTPIYNVTEDGRLIYKNMNYKRHSAHPDRCSISIYNCGMSFTLSEFMITAVEDEDFTYEPYREEEMEVELPQTVYGGYVDIAKGELVETCKLRYYDGTSGWSDGGVYTGHRFNSYLDNAASNAKGNIDIIACNYLKPAPNGQSTNVAVYGNNIITVATSAKGVYVNVDFADTVEEWKAYLTDHPLTLVYNLETPIHYPLPPETIKTLKGTNNIYTNANGKSIIKYWTH